MPRLALIRPMPSATALDRPTAMPPRFKPLASALAAVLAVPRTVTSFTVLTAPPSMDASTVGLALAVATAPLAARPRPPASAVAWAWVSMVEWASTLRARTTSPLCTPICAPSAIEAMVLPPASACATEAPPATSPTLAPVEFALMLRWSWACTSTSPAFLTTRPEPAVACVWLVSMMPA
ncbi:hypothetical protein D3C71_1678510 [compost metagenome]